MGGESKLVIVSNRLPIVIKRLGTKWNIEPASGGLVSAITPLLKKRGGLWIGWAGVTKEELRGIDIDSIMAAQMADAGYSLKNVLLSRQEYELYYKGFSNEIIWPLFHGFFSLCRFNPKYWYAYETVNRKFAKVIKDNVREKDYIWVHDYHLFNVAKYLRKLSVNNSIGYFLHIPFPPLDNFIKLPWRFEIVRALLEYDLVGFQTSKDKRNFLDAVGYLLRDVRIYRRRSLATISYNSKQIKVGAFPISIDYKWFTKDAKNPQIQENSKKITKMLPDRQLVLGVDRLDYSKGLIQKFEAFRRVFRVYPELKGRLTLVQVVVPSRSDIPEYSKLKTEIEQLVGCINGEFTVFGWVPIYYMFRSLSREELISYYMAADMALVTPINDGMNLVAKEFCATKIDNNGVLILSEFAGAAAQLQKHCLLVNPMDINLVADAIYRAYHMDRSQKKAMMSKLRNCIKKYDIFWWIKSFLGAALQDSTDTKTLYEEFALTLQERQNV